MCISGLELVSVATHICICLRSYCMRDLSFRFRRVWCAGMVSPRAFLLNGFPVDVELGDNLNIYTGRCRIAEAVGYSVGQVFLIDVRTHSVLENTVRFLDDVQIVVLPFDPEIEGSSLQAFLRALRVVDLDEIHDVSEVLLGMVSPKLTSLP